MPPSEQGCRVLVVGAGPAGLFLACELRRHGVVCRIVEKSSAPCNEARATGIQPRTLEILEHVGVIDEFLRHGNRIRGVKTYVDGNRLLDHKSLEAIESPFPFEISLPQSRTERLLFDQLARRGLAVEWNVELVSFEQHATGVQAVLREATGKNETVDSDYLVGCDGSHSTVRHALGMQLEGMDYAAVFAVADVRVDGPLAKDEVSLFCSPTVALLFAPLPNDRVLVFCDLPADARQGPEDAVPTLAEMQGYLDQAGPGNLALRDPAWLTYFRCHERLAPRYQVDRVFLAGDAAHVQSPAGGQGMNTGFQDGFNLAWKLALVLRGAARSSLLESYHAERHPIGRQMIALSDQVHRSLFEHHPQLRDRAGKWVASLLARFHLLHPGLRTLDQTHVSYHDSPIVRDQRPRRAGEKWKSAPRAGERAPDGKLLSHPSNRAVRLFDLIREPRHHLLIFEGDREGANPAELNQFTAAIARDYADLIEPLLLWRRDGIEETVERGWLDSDGALHQRYGARTSSVYLIRPDGHVAFRSPILDEPSLRAYLADVFVARG